jgi:hypothetical protein
MDRPPLPQLVGFLGAYDPHVAELALALRDVILDEAPDADESIYQVYTVAIWFGFSGKMNDMFCYIATSADHVNLGFPRGAKMADPSRVMEGVGKIMRHVKFSSLAELEAPWVRRYIRESMAQAAPEGTRGTGRSVVKSSGGSGIRGGRKRIAKNGTRRRGRKRRAKR